MYGPAFITPMREVGQLLFLYAYKFISYDNRFTTAHQRQPSLHREESTPICTVFAHNGAVGAVARERVSLSPHTTLPD